MLGLRLENIAGKFAFVPTTLTLSERAMPNPSHAGW